ncbi:M56 family metallopeptidase [bacterium]|nr:M56 family metallopeptidase [bacterium]
MVDISLRATLVLCAAWLLCLIIRRSKSGIRYQLLTWTFALLLILPMLSALPRFSILPVSRISKPVVQPIFPDWLEATLESGHSGHWSATNTNLRWPFLLWLGGAAFFSWRLIRSYSAVSGLRKKAEECSFAPFPLPRSMKVLVSETLQSPAAAGLFRPVVLVPQSCSTWTPQDWQIVMEHESEHIDRRHSLTKLLARICCVMYWFHPLVWWAASRHSVETERVCDEHVVACGIDAAAYAELLVRFAAHQQEPWIARTGLLGYSSTLELRVNALLNEFPSKLSARLRITVVLLVCFTTSATVLVDFGWSDNRGPTENGFAALPAPNSIMDPYREPESELVPEDGIGRVSSVPLDDPRDRYLFELLQQLSHREARSRADFVAKRARWGMAQAKGGELIRSLLKRLDDEDWRVRAYAAYILGLGRVRDAAPPLIRDMEHPVWRMRAMAAFALAQIRDPAAAKILQKSLSDPAWQVRLAALPYFGSDPRWRALVEPMQNDENGLIRYTAIEILGRMEK